MIGDPRQKELFRIAWGFGLQLVGGALLAAPGALAGLGLILAMLGSFVLVWGCFGMARHKGYPPIVGLLGLFGCVGLLLLSLLPDKGFD